MTRTIRAALLAATLIGCSESGLKVQNDPPEVSFVSPAAGSTVLERDPLTLVASVVDAGSETEELTLRWTLSDGSTLSGAESIDGELVRLDLSAGLDPGEFAITLKAIDGAGMDGEDTLPLSVQDDLPPEVSFESPTDGEVFGVGELVRISVRVSDAETEDLGSLSLSWSGAAAGLEDAPTRPDSAGLAELYLDGLPEGEAYVGVSVADGRGQTASASVAFEIVDPDADEDGHDGVEFGGDDCDDGDAGVYPGAEDRCDGADNDCDGEIDDDPTDGDIWYADDDGDGFGAGAEQRACEAPIGMVDNALDCDDGEAAINPEATEICDDRDADEDCDGASDDDDASTDPSTETWTYADRDGDRFGDPDTGALACDAASSRVANDQDCDDNAAGVNPDAAEVCDDLDNDCDGLIDDADPSLDTSTGTISYSDADGDGYGDPDSAVAACDPATGRVADAIDCDDGDGDVHPGATERCDDVDNDCDGEIDSDATDRSTWYADADDDGYGDADASTLDCDRPAGYGAEVGDCDDADADIHPGARERCDDVDEDCDGEIDEDAVDATTWYGDEDGDGYGSEEGTALCDPPADSIADHSDCDDANELVYPGAPEICDGVQNDCDAVGWASADEAGTASWVDVAGAITDYTSTLAAGTSTTPATVTLSSEGTLYVCEGTWYVNLHITGSDVSIVGPTGADDTILSGAGKTEDVVAIRATDVTLYLEGVTIRDAYGCWAGLSNYEVTTCTTTRSYGTLYEGADVTVVDSVITENDGWSYAGVMISGTSASRSSLTLIDTEVSWNTWYRTSGGPFVNRTDLTCTGSSAVRAGFWGNYHGIQIFPESTLSSESCDWGTGSEDNTYDLSLMYGGNRTGYGDDETFTCTEYSCSSG